ncbi:hypothetical protein EON66_11960 [archaeon]|nr:MAG: hypothetical protein EON66_11960 [archaeon]
MTAEHVHCAQWEDEGCVHRFQREQEQAPGGEGGESGSEGAHLEGVLACDRRRDGEVCKVALVAPLAAVGRDAERAEKDVAHVRPRVFYVGDGRNDVCPALHLKRCVHGWSAMLRSPRIRHHSLLCLRSPGTSVKFVFARVRMCSCACVCVRVVQV